MQRSVTFVAECFWPDVTEADLEALDKRLADAAGELGRRGSPARYLESILVREDEVVLCRFEGSAASVRRLADRAAVPYARLLETTSTGGTRHRRAERNGEEVER